MSEAGTEAAVERFWAMARDGARLTSLPGYLPATSLEILPPPVWSFGAGPEDDELLALVLDGRKSAISSARSDYDSADVSLPEVGALGILADHAGRPRALVETTAVEVVAFDQVSESHARAEGEGDLSLTQWCDTHESYLTSPDGPRDAPVVLERFRVAYRA